MPAEAVARLRSMWTLYSLVLEEHSMQEEKVRGGGEASGLPHHQGGTAPAAHLRAGPGRAVHLRAGQAGCRGAAHDMAA